MRYSLFILSAAFLGISIFAANMSVLLQFSLFMIGFGLFSLGLISIDFNLKL